MKHETATSVVQMEPEALRALVTSVDETLATGANNHSKSGPKKFGIWDLQKIRNKSRNRGIVIR